MLDVELRIHAMIPPKSKPFWPAARETLIAGMLIFKAISKYGPESDRTIAINPTRERLIKLAYATHSGSKAKGARSSM
jgi:hypothetical protein